MALFITNVIHQHIMTKKKLTLLTSSIVFIEWLEFSAMYLIDCYGIIRSKLTII
ncbi:hypothetical protein Psal071_02269 [Piscirickettsia salmonis]|nr:hypothetical protein K661_02390 [Piscirickettsia salmonis LF-89 = ATCC VR-1361]QGN78046.1 hypothetical protein Psal001_02266 [Piscirickettsia salmonis]QGN81628.1 hypothetical protein Psal002_02283 [Piscirickettsia salmonis]QGN84100.1 hypothetical protein Psal003_01149 [Piscirickettsia salmonis]QGN87611.1 hypothetical protein Psal004_01146 [Piscirickettsia salmonis]